MILKIRQGQSWVVYDNLSRVRFGGSGEGRIRRHKETGEWQYRDSDSLVGSEAKASYGKAGPDPDAVWLNEDRARARLGGVPADMESPWEYPAWASVSDPEGRGRFFVFDDAFLLNDSGGTVERIR